MVENGYDTDHQPNWELDDAMSEGIGVDSKLAQDGDLGRTQKRDTLR